MLRDEVAHAVGDRGLEARRIGGRNRRRLPRDTFHRQRLRGIQRPPRTRANSQHALAPIDRQNAAANRARHGRQSRRGQIDPRQGIPQLQFQVALETRDDRQVIDRRIVVEAHDDQSLAMIARQLQANRRIGPRLHEDPADLLGIVRDAAGRVSSSVTPANRSATDQAFATPG